MEGHDTPSPGADVARASPVPVQMRHGRAQSRCRCGRGEPSPGADMARRVRPVPVQMRPGCVNQRGVLGLGLTATVCLFRRASDELGSPRLLPHIPGNRSRPARAAVDPQTCTQALARHLCSFASTSQLPRNATPRCHGRTAGLDDQKQHIPDALEAVAVPYSTPHRWQSRGMPGGLLSTHGGDWRRGGYFDFGALEADLSAFGSLASSPRAKEWNRCRRTTRNTLKQKRSYTNRSGAECHTRREGRKVGPPDGQQAAKSTHFSAWRSVPIEGSSTLRGSLQSFAILPSPIVYAWRIGQKSAMASTPPSLASPKYW